MGTAKRLVVELLYRLHVIRAYYRMYNDQTAKVWYEIKWCWDG